MTDDLHNDIRTILQKTTRIETALWPDENQPGVLTKHDERLDKLEDWKSHIAGGMRVLGFLWTALAALFGYHVSKH